MDDVQSLLSEGVEDAYLFTVHSSRRNLEVYPDPNEYVVTFDAPFRNVVGFEVVQALLPRTQYTVDEHNRRLVLYVAETRKVVDVPVGEYTHETLLEALRVVLHPWGVSPSFQDRGRNVFELASDRTLKLDVLESTMARLLGFNTDAEYPDLERVPMQGESTELLDVEHAWIPETSTDLPWRDRNHPASDAYALDHVLGTGTASTELTPTETFALSNRTLSASFRYAHDTYTKDAFRMPRRVVLLRDPHGYEVRVGLNEWSVRRYVPFQDTFVRRGTVEPTTVSVPLENDAFDRRFGFSFVHTLESTTGSVALVPSSDVYVGEELFGADAHGRGHEGLVLTHVHRPGWFEVRDRVHDDEIVRTPHIDADTNLVTQQAYLVATFRYHTIGGTVPMFRYGSHPEDERQGGYVQVSMQGDALVVDRVVEETVEQIAELDLVPSVHDLDGGDGFAEPLIEDGTRYASQLATEYTFVADLVRDPDTETHLRPHTFHRLLWLGRVWSCRVGSFDPRDDDDSYLRVPIHVYDRTRTQTTLVEEVRQDTSADRLGTGVIDSHASWSELKSAGVFRWTDRGWSRVFEETPSSGSYVAETAQTAWTNVWTGVFVVEDAIAQGTATRESHFDPLQVDMQDAKEAWEHGPETLDPVRDQLDAWIQLLDAYETDPIDWEVVREGLHEGTVRLAASVGAYHPDVGGFMGGAALWVQKEVDETQDVVPGPLVPTHPLGQRSTWETTAGSLQVGDRLSETRVDGEPCLALVFRAPSTTPVQFDHPVYRRTGNPTKQLPPFVSDTEIQAGTPGWSNVDAWTAEASSFAGQAPFLALNTTNLDATDGWRSRNRLSPSAFPIPSESDGPSPLYYFRQPDPDTVDTLLSQMQDSDLPSDAFAQTGSPQADLVFQRFANLGSDWDRGAGGPDALGSPGDARVPGLFACKLRMPETVDRALNTVVCAIGDDNLAMAVGFDADGVLFLRSGVGTSLDPSDTSYVRVDVRRRSDVLGERGWLAWFLIPSPFGVQAILYWNGARLGTGNRTSSTVTRWTGSGSGGYLEFPSGRTVRPWADQTPHWISVRHTSLPHAVLRYTIETSNENRESEYAFPRAFRLEGSTDGVHWTVLDRRAVSEWTFRTVREFDVNAGGLYTHFRLFIESASRTYVSIGRWNMTLEPANKTDLDLYETDVWVVGGRNVSQNQDVLTERSLIPRIEFSRDSGSAFGYVRSLRPTRETGVSLESKVYVLQSQNPVGLVRRGGRVIVTNRSDDEPLRIDATVTALVRPQGTHPVTGGRTDGVSWFARYDDIDDVIERYRVNRLVGSGSLNVFRPRPSERSERTVLYSKLQDGKRYTLTVRLLPDGSLRYVVMEPQDPHEYASRFYTVDPIPVTGLRDDVRTGRMPGFENATLTVPRTNTGVQTNALAPVLERLHAYTGTKGPLFVPSFDYPVSLFSFGDDLASEIIRVSEEEPTLSKTFPRAAFRGDPDPGATATVSWEWNPSSSDVYAWSFQVWGTNLDAHPHETGVWHVETYDAFANAWNDVLDPFSWIETTATRVTLWLREATPHPLRLRPNAAYATWIETRAWDVTAWVVHPNDARTCFVAYEPRTFASLARHAFALSDTGAVRWMDGEERQAEPVPLLGDTQAPSQVFVEPMDLQVTLPDDRIQGSQFRTERVEWARTEYALRTFEDAFRFRESSLFAYSRSVGPGGTFTRDYVSSGSVRLETREAFRWIHYFTVDEIELEDVSMHAWTLMFPDDEIFERTVPLTFTLRDKNAATLDEFTIVWNGPEGTDSEGRVLETRRGTERSGPFTGLSSLVVSFDPFRTSRDIRLQRGVRYSMIVSTLDVYVRDLDDAVSELDRTFPLRVPYTVSGNGVLGYIATYEEETNRPTWIDGFVPFRLRTARVEHRLTSPGITTLSPDSFVKLSIPEIERQVHVHRNYDAWSGGLATFFLSPELRHKEFHEHMHVGLIKRFFPLSRLDQLTIRFLNEDNRPYNFRGVNHVLRLVVRYLVPKWNPVPSPTTGVRTSMIESESSASSESIAFDPSATDPQTPDDMIRVLQKYARVIQTAGRAIEGSPSASA